MATAPPHTKAVGGLWTEDSPQPDFLHLIPREKYELIKACGSFESFERMALILGNADRHLGRQQRSAEEVLRTVRESRAVQHGNDCGPAAADRDRLSLSYREAWERYPLWPAPRTNPMG